MRAPILPPLVFALPPAACGPKLGAEEHAQALDAFATVQQDALVLWGWDPGGERAPVSVPHDEFVAEFERWAAAGGPCPEDQLADAAVRQPLR